MILHAAAACFLMQTSVPPAPMAGLDYTEPFFPSVEHDPAVPTPDSILGFAVGSRPATHAQIEACMKAWAGQKRAKLFEYAKSHEGRTLYYIVISSEENISKLDGIAADIAKVADPRSSSDTDAIVKRLPAVAWMAYVIHGDETSGSDASLALAHHLLSASDEETKRVLQNTLVIIDPLMNPDGRDRFLSQLAHDRTAQPNVDDQSVMHSRPWPAGRTNHYLFDMNRDWILGTQPESRGRIAAIGKWNPQLLMESHEMGSQDSFLFSPPREPVNPNLAPTMKKWWNVFANDMASAFDAHQWRYYHGEWNEEWYPGYSSAWAGYRGAIDILFEQASISTDAVRKASGGLETYRESVHHQLAASMANIKTLAEHREEILRDYAEQRKVAVSADSPYARRVFAVPPVRNWSRVRAFVDLMRLQGIEVFSATKEFTGSGKNQVGLAVADQKFPEGTLLIPNRQPQARLLAAMLEFDTRMSDEFLRDEYRELLRFGRSKLYDVTGWNITMLHGLEAFELTTGMPPDAQEIQEGPRAPDAAGLKEGVKPTAWVIDGEDDLSVAAAGRLMERGVRCRIALKPFTWDGIGAARGSVIVMEADNRMSAGGPGGAGAAVTATMKDLGLAARSVASGLGPGDDPDIGGENFVLLEQPRIGIVSREPYDVYSFGEVWHLLDHTMGLRVTCLDNAALGGTDLRRYNVLVIPDGAGETLKANLETIRAWVKNGGTLIAIGGSAGGLATESAGVTGARVLPEVVTKLDDYIMAIAREWEGRYGAPTSPEVWSQTSPDHIAAPWTSLSGDSKPSDEEAKRRDAWKSIFMPTGAILAGRVDDRHWLTAGCGERLPVVVRNGPVLMAAGGVQAPVRLGVYSPAPHAAEPAKDGATDTAKNAKEEKDKDGAKEGKPDKDPKEAAKITHWAPLPPGQELRLRMSGLLWPAAGERVADSAYVTREAVGAGQVILFAETPTFRGSAKGTMRVFANAAVLGPGMGANQPIKLRERD